MWPVHQAASPVGELAAPEQTHAICYSIHRTPQDTQPSLPKQKVEALLASWLVPLCAQVSLSRS